MPGSPSTPERCIASCRLGSAPNDSAARAVGKSLNDELEWLSQRVVDAVLELPVAAANVLVLC